MSKLIDLIREAFTTATADVSSPRAPFGDKSAEETRLGKVTFADDDELPNTDEYGDFYTVYSPLAWREKDGKLRYGYLITGANNGRVYGLETANGETMTASAAKKMLYDLAGNVGGRFSNVFAPGYRTYNPEIKQRFRLIPSRQGKDLYED